MIGCAIPGRSNGLDGDELLLPVATGPQMTAPSARRTQTFCAALAGAAAILAGAVVTLASAAAALTGVATTLAGAGAALSGAVATLPGAVKNNPKAPRKRSAIKTNGMARLATMARMTNPQSKAFSLDGAVNHLNCSRYGGFRLAGHCPHERPISSAKVGPSQNPMNLGLSQSGA